MYDPRAFHLSDMVRLDAAIRHAAEGATSMEDAACAVVSHLYEGLVDKQSGERACVLARLFVTRRLGSLEPEVRDRVREDLARSGVGADADVRCLALLATAGEEPAWNDRRASRHHRAVPLVSEEAVASSPMISELFAQLGIDVARVVDGGVDGLVVGGLPGATQVFHVAEAAGSPHVPAQRDFVEPYGVRSVLGFGGVLPDGELYAVILFTRSPVPRETAKLFSTVASSVGLALLPQMGRRTFRSEPALEPAEHAQLAEWRAEAFARLLELHERTVLDQTLRLEEAMVALEDRAADLARSRAAARESEALTSAMLASALDAVISIDAAGHVIEWNGGAERIFGHARDEVLGRVMVDFLVPPHLREQHRVGVARYLSTGEGPILDRRLVTEALHRDGHTLPVELAVTHVDLPDRHVFTAFLRDVSDVRRAEQERSALLESERAARAAAEAAADRLARLQSVASRLADSTTAAQVAEVVVTIGLQQMGGATGALWGVDPDGPSLYLLHAVGPSIGMTAMSPVPMDAAFPIPEAVRGSVPVWVSSREERDARYPLMRHLESPAEAFAVLPLEAEDRTLGALVLAFTEARGFTEEERRFLQALAVQAAQSLDRARLRDLERESARRLAFLAEASRILGSSLDYRATLQNVTELALSMLGEACVVDLLEPSGEVRRVAVAHTEPAKTRFLRLADAAAQPGSSLEDVVGEPPRLVARALTSGRTVTVDDVAAAELHGDSISAAGHTAGGDLDLGPAMVVPLVAHGRTIGALSLAGTRGAPPYDSADASLAEELAQRAAVAIDNARAHHARTEAAVTLQRSLLPAGMPRTPGLRLASRYLPGSFETEVGGDWFDVIPLSVGRCAIVVGDVMGRGVRAAAVMGQLRAAVRAYASLDLRPDVLLTYLDALVNSLEGEQIVTCAYAVYDALTGTVVVSQAGHVPPMVAAEGHVHPLELPPGAPLGVGGVGFATTEVSLPPGATIVLYTDGLVESRDRDLDAGLDALRASLTEVLAESDGLQQLCDGVLARLVDVEGHDDDVAMLVAQMTGADGEPISRMVLAPDPEMVAEARAFAQGSVRTWGLGERTDTVGLLVTELVTNGLRHAGTTLELRLGLTDRTLAIEVRDGSSQLPVRRRGAGQANDEGGRGLLLVESLSDRWGVRRHADGKTVWCELTAFPRG